jgi:hypothetical protein
VCGAGSGNKENLSCGSRQEEEGEPMDDEGEELRVNVVSCAQ